MNENKHIFNFLDLGNEEFALYSLLGRGGIPAIAFGRKLHKKKQRFIQT